MVARARMKRDQSIPGAAWLSERSMVMGKRMENCILEIGYGFE